MDRKTFLKKVAQLLAGKAVMAVAAITSALCLGPFATFVWLVALFATNASRSSVSVPPSGGDPPKE